MDRHKPSRLSGEGLGATLTGSETPSFGGGAGEGHMAKNGFKLIDAEMHVMEPVDLWQRYIAPEFRVPRGELRLAAVLAAPHGRALRMARTLR
jgi:hypothetical protein